VTEGKDRPVRLDSVKESASSVDGEEAEVGGGAGAGKISVVGGSGGGGSGSMSLNRFGNLRWTRWVHRSDSGKASSWNGSEPMDSKLWFGPVVPC
jgi:hypothetical protein